MVVGCAMILVCKMAEMGQKTDGGFQILAGYKHQAGISLRQEKQRGRLLELTVYVEANV